MSDDSDDDFEDGLVERSRANHEIIQRPQSPRRRETDTGRANHEIIQRPHSPPAMPGRNDTIMEKFNYVYYYVQKESDRYIHSMVLLNGITIHIHPKENRELNEIKVVLHNDSYRIQTTKTWNSPNISDGSQLTTELITDDYMQSIAWINWSLSHGTGLGEGYVPRPTKQPNSRPASAPPGGRRRRVGANASTLTILDRLVDAIHLQI
jgi:hypothetical protein